MRYVLLTVAVFALAGAGSVLAGDKPVESVTKGAGHGVSTLVNAPGKIVKNTVTTSNPIATGTKKATDSAIEGTVGGVAAKGMASGTEGVARTVTSGVVPKGAGQGVASLIEAPKKIIENVITTTNPVATGTRKATDAAVEGTVGGVVATGMAAAAEASGRIVHKGVTGGRD